MEYRIDCPCGRHITVREGAAGMSFPCECGHAINVPTRSQLRKSAGLTANDIGPEKILVHLLASGQLPRGKACSFCGNQTAAIRQVRVECIDPERKKIDYSVALTGSFKWFIERVFTPWWLYLLMRRNDDYDEVTSDPILDLPFLVCELCQPALKDELIIKKCLSKELEYRRLLEKFPGTKIALL